MYQCVIIDDELHAIEGLRQFLSHVPEFEIKATFSDPILALKVLNDSDPVDLILLDVDMPGISGIELSHIIRNKTDKLVFTTAHTKYGYDAFEVNADGYLLKPYNLSKFLVIIHKLFPKTEAKPLGNADDDQEDFFFVKSKDENLKLVRINFKDIVAIESKLNYIRIHTLEKSTLTYMSLGEMSHKLMGNNDFIQFQRSFILNKRHIEYIDGNTIAMTGGIKISVGDYYRKNFNEFVERNVIKGRRRS